MSGKPNNCAVCGEVAKLMCEKCFEYYCSRKCQIDDWPSHKKLCVEIPKLVSNSSTDDLPKFTDSAKADALSDDSNDSFESVDNNLEELIPNSNDTNNAKTNDHHSETFGKENVENQKAMEKLEISEVGEKVETSNKQISNIPSNTGNVKSSSIKSLLENRLKPVNTSSKFEINRLNANMPSSISKLDFSNLKSCHPKAYLQPMAVETDSEIEVSVLFIDDKNPNKVWVMETKNCQLASNLLVEIQKYILIAKNSIPEDEIKKDSLVLAPYENIYYRAQVIYFSQPKKSAKVLLIDYGNDFYAKYSELKSPLDYMKKIPAFAFDITISNSTPVIVGDKIKIKSNTIKPRTDDNYVIRSKCQESILSTILNYPKVRIVAILGKKHAIAIYADSEFSQIEVHLNKILSDKSKYVLNKVPIEGDYVAAAFKEQAYQRGIIIGIHGENYLIYGVDIGKVFRTTEVKMIPNKLSFLPYRSILLQIKKHFIKEIEFINKINESVLFTIQPSTRNYNDKAIDCRLLHIDKEIIEAKALIWSGDVTKINLQHFQLSLMPSDIVKITHFVDCSQVYLSVNSYSSLLKDTIKTFKQNLSPNVMDIVLAKSADGSVFRGQIFNTTHNGNWDVQNIDTGSSEIVSKESIYKINTFFKYLPCYTKKYNLSHVHQIKTLYYDPMSAIDILNRYKNYGTSFTMKFDENYYDHVNLYFVNNKKISLNGQLVTLLMKGNETVVEQDLVETVLDVKSDIKYTMKDIDKIALNIGKSETILVLDVSNVKNGYFAGCNPSINWSLKMEKEYSPTIDALCTRGDIEKEYTPILNEVCFVIDKGDHWYRGLCTEKCWNNEFIIMLVDFGSKTRVDKTKIRQMRQTFLFPTAVNICYLADVNEFKTLESTIIPGKTIVASIEKNENNMLMIRLQP